jgi:tetratricopeptide (TPR) repeat protein
MSTDQRRLGPFILEEKLGAGGMGEVYRATHVETRRQVALKVLSAKAASSRRIVARFARELEILKALKHPNIVRCYGGGRHEAEAYLVMELVGGGSLSSLLRRRGRLPWETVIDYGLQICDGLAYAHEWGIVHRDLTPANILLTEEGQAKIADFGIARVQYGKRLTATKHTLGTVAYMAPEQIRGAPPVSHRTDLYTLGCVLFEMLTGRLPFTCESTAQMLYHHLGEPPPRVSSLVLDCPVWLDGLINQMLEKDPLKRPHDATAVAQALREVQEKVAAGAGVVSHTAAGGPSALKAPKEKEDKAQVKKLLGRKKRKKGRQVPIYERAWFLAACLLLVVGLGAWLLWPDNEDKLFAKMEKYIAAEDRFNAERAGEDLLRRFPEGAHAAQARQYLDSVEMDKAEHRLLSDLEHRRKPKTEGGRLYADALGYEQFGDHVTALEKYQSIVNLLKEEENERPYVNLAKRQISALMGRASGAEDRAKFIESRLKQADEQYAEGETLEAHKIWNSIVTLYGDNRELRPLVERAQKKLSADDDKAESETAEKGAASAELQAESSEPKPSPQKAAPPPPQTTMAPATAAPVQALPRVPGRRRRTLTREMVDQDSASQSSGEAVEDNPSADSSAVQPDS